ncbi:hypothetical protein [Streptomyces spectabilis]|uniref:Flagellar hook-length control protein FliK n=1 Tax=Streptomyces spectabilis TaxID=68270 RepID=A0A516RHG5_STRST|nr:hypothetical protein [Streptomyces spectabilis]QDQ15102.1 hypothetical protein FH965_34890 [Streptomyces spectabilis]
MAGAIRAFAAALGLLVASAVLGVGPGPAASAAAVDTGRGHAGFCRNGEGVTVVVDFRELGGTTLVRCAVGSQRTGLAALKDAGIQVTGTNRWGESFICRLEGKPGADREPCLDTPPAKAYWSYWHASDGGRWTYSQYGATYRTPPKGSFEGWSFSLDRDQGEAPAPRVAPRRPAAPGSGGGGGAGGGGHTGGGKPGGGAPDRGTTPDTPGRVAPPAGGSPGDSNGARPPADGGGLAPPPGHKAEKDGGKDAEDKKAKDPKQGKKDGKKSAKPSPSVSSGPAPAPSEAADWTGGEDKRTVSAAKDDGVPTGTVVGAAAAVALAVAGGVTAWRRRGRASDGTP